jgi:hypothetical protein
MERGHDDIGRAPNRIEHCLNGVNHEGFVAPTGDRDLRLARRKKLQLNRGATGGSFGDRYDSAPARQAGPPTAGRVMT